MSNECSVMETKLRYRWLPDDAEISNEDEYEYESEKEKQQSKKRKVTGDDVALKIKSSNASTSSYLPLEIMYPVDGRNICEKFVLGKNIEGDDTASKLAKKIKSRNASTSSHLPLKIMYSMKQESKRQGERAIEIESEPVDDTNIGEKYVWKKKIERDVIGVRPTNTKNSHLPLKVMCSVMEEKRIGTRPTKTKNSHLSLETKCSVIQDKRREIERIREIEKVKSGEEKMIKKEEDEERMAFWARVRGPAEFLDDPRGLQSTTVEDVTNLLQGKSHNELELLQSQVEFQMCFSSANDVEYWKTVLQVIKVKACLDIHANIFGKFYGQKHRNFCNAGKYDQAGTGVAEGTGSSCSPELLHGEETGDNFEMKTMGIMEDGDALSGNYDEVICQSQVCWSQNKCRPRKPKYLDPVHNEYGWNNYNQTH